MQVKSSQMHETQSKYYMSFSFKMHEFPKKNLQENKLQGVGYRSHIRRFRQQQKTSNRQNGPRRYGVDQAKEDWIGSGAGRLNRTGPVERYKNRKLGFPFHFNHSFLSLKSFLLTKTSHLSLNFFWKMKNRR